MSNPARAPTVPLSAEQVRRGRELPEAHFDVTLDFSTRESMRNNIDSHRAILRHLGMEPSHSFVVPRNLSCNPEVFHTAKPVLGRAKGGPIQFRHRSGVAHSVLAPAYRMLPKQVELADKLTTERFGFGTQEAVRDKMQEVVYVDSGAHGCLTRVARYYPRDTDAGLVPVTRAEALTSLRSSGIDLGRLSKEERPAKALWTEDDRERVRINKKAGNGFPVESNGHDEVALGKVLKLSETMRGRFVEAFRQDRVGGVAAEYKSMMEHEPWLVTAKGKAKADYYSVSKVEAHALRFYLEPPRQLVLNMQIATQALEGLSLHVLDDSRLHTGIGASLMHGGANRLVDALDTQLRSSSGSFASAFVHVGDDSWVVLKEGPSIYMLALDCSSFDLTQNATVTASVHDALRDELALVDVVAAQLWHAWMRERNVVLSRTLTYRMRHGGPSGTPLQSKVNDVLMDVLLRRLLVMLEETLEREGFTDDTVQEAAMLVGERLGFSLRVEQFSVCRADTLKEALITQPFLFLGYYFYTHWGWGGSHESRVVIDLPRSFARTIYPSIKWEKSKMRFEVMEAVRLGNIVLNMGLFPDTVQEAGAYLVSAVEALLEDTIKRFGDVEDDAMRWAVQENPHTANVIPSLSGLLGALRNREAVWRDAPLTVAEQNAIVIDVALAQQQVEGVPVEAGPLAEYLWRPASPPGNWADEVEQAEATDVAGKLRFVPSAPVAIPRLPRLQLPRPLPPLPAPTPANHGREPPKRIRPPPREFVPRVVPSVRKGRVSRMRDVEWEEDVSFDSFDFDTEPFSD